MRATKSALSLILFVALSIAAPALAQQPAARPAANIDVACEADVLAGLTRLVGHVPEDFERGAFILRTDGGLLMVLPWPLTHEYHRATYHGALLPSAVAIAHSHPAALPQPSSGDIAQAKKLGLPVYVITRLSLRVALPDGNVRELGCRPYAQPPAAAVDAAK